MGGGWKEEMKCKAIRFLEYEEDRTSGANYPIFINWPRAYLEINVVGMFGTVAVVTGRNIVPSVGL